MKTVVRNNLQLDDFCKEVCRKIGNDFNGKPYSVDIRPFKQPKTSQQNKLFHALIGELAEHTGYSASDMKAIIKDTYGLVDTVEVGPQVLNKPRSIADYNIDQISFLIDRVFQLGAEVNCVFQQNP